ncbi:A/G-specific adenine glycosylase [Salegentibacter sp. JZCK2]|uniref:A/G-specific adenine glycosylase n=1 Tax=Salegentibacter tibetensis TaxID=2873600 RepID=UPI001CC98484|nr:A/G-specific adenine glycosylase [Salegentibacter tibetensis]MBZ9729819.1 A/G-specific adenine glycosylase [Salegentibacter tibetensis]
MVFSKVLIDWYLKNKRELPWRKTSDPYHIWLSEIMLQQTRIEQGLPYYQRFTTAFPTVFDLAEAPQEKVLKLWQGLGYYSRARNLHESAKYVAEELNGVFPKSYIELKKLKGVGDYTAAAIASICYDEPVAVVDGNVYRVLARFFDVETPINSTAGIKEFKALASELLDEKYPSSFNQSLMEFGALQCKPRNPLCESCPLSSGCLALQKNKIQRLPVKMKKAKVKKRYFNYLVVYSEENKTLLQQRTGKGIWNGLYEFPLIETKKPVREGAFPSEEKINEILGEQELSLQLHNKKPVVHKLSHQHIYTHFWWVKAEKIGKEGIPVKNVKDYPVPVLIANFLEETALETYSL